MAFIFCFALIALSISSVSASDVSQNATDILNDIDDVDFKASEDMNAIYVDTHGKISNDGSQSSPLNSIKLAVANAHDNATIYIASGEYKTNLNTKITIDKSLTFVGSDNTVINGQNTDYLFDIKDGISVTFKNIKFINAYKKPECPVGQ